MALAHIVVALLVAGGSGLPGLFLGCRSPWGQRLATMGMTLAAALGLAGAVHVLGTGDYQALALPVALLGAPVEFAVDALSAFFLVPVFAMGGLGAWYGQGYWRQADHPTNGRRLRLFWGVLVMGMALLLVSRHALLFLLGWETMALAAFFLIATEDEQAEVRGSALLYLIATHVGTLCLLGMFALLRVAAGSFALRPLGVDDAGLGLLSGIFVLALLGFGLKAGIMPLHFWLPSAHANAPSHVSAFLSGVLIKMGIYGLVRVCLLLPQPPIAWGVLLLALGTVSGLLGVVFAIAQHDLKRLLAYHSVENIGIIVMGLGLAMIGRSCGRPEWVVLGLAGGLLHVWNHGLFKALLFLAAGSVVHAVHTREIDRLGGLAKAMPWTATLFLLGAVAICGLPPLNGFVSELLVYLGLLQTMAPDAGAPAWPAAALAAPVLAMIGALAVACFVKVYGAVFLGEPRSAATAHAHEAPPTMLVPMGVLAAGCLGIGLAPMLVVPWLQHLLAAWLPADVAAAHRLADLAPLTWVSVLGIALVTLSGVGLLGCRGLWRRFAIGRPGTWDCGYAAPSARMQYTGSSFADFIVGLFHFVLRPHRQAVRLAAIFPPPAHFVSHVHDVVLDRQILPAMRTARGWLGQFRWVQQGQTQSYLLYILFTVLGLLAWLMPWRQLFDQIMTR